jgi:hypothetical protein
MGAIPRFQLEKRLLLISGNIVGYSQGLVDLIEHERFL